MTVAPIKMTRKVRMVEISHSSHLIRHDEELIAQMLNQDTCLTGWQRWHVDGVWGRT